MTDHVLILTGSSAKKVSDNDTLTAVTFLFNFHFNFWRL